MKKEDFKGRIGIRYCFRCWLLWFLVLFVSVIVTCYLAIIIRHTISNHWQSIFVGLNSYIRAGGIVLVGIFGAFGFQQLFSFKFRQWHSWLRIPPIGFAVFISGLIVSAADVYRLIQSNKSLFQWSDWLIIWVTGIVSVALINILKWFGSRKTKNKIDCIITTKEREKIDTSIFEYLCKEGPLENRKDMLFNRNDMIERLCRLFSSDSSRDISIGIVGEFGSGKTSLMNLLKKHLDEISSIKYIFVLTSAWGFQNSASVLEYILESIVNAMDELIDCSSIKSLPSIYRKTLEDTGSWWGGFLSKVYDKDQKLVLKRLEPMLELLDAKIALVVEDLDRQESVNFNINDVLATLYFLKNVKGVSFIITGSKLTKHTIDYAKLCDHIEEMPDLQQSEIVDLIIKIRHDLLNKSNIFSTIPQNSIEFNKESNKIHLAMGTPTISLILAEIINTPRQFRHVFRRIYTAWNQLKGEIDIDHLIVASFLRHCTPEAFGFLLQHSDVLRVKPESSSSDRARWNKDKAVIKQQWEMICEKCDWPIKETTELASFLFPNLHEILSLEGVFSQDKRLQGVSCKYPIDYWKRMLSENLNEAEVRDQDVLRQIQDWENKNETSSDALLVQSLVENDDFVDRWEHFSDIHSFDKRIQLLDSVTRKLLKKFGSQCSHKHKSLLSIWRNFNRVGIDQKSFEKWFLQNVPSFITISINLVVGFRYYWCSKDMGLFSTQNFGNTLDLEILKVAKIRFLDVNSTNTLINALDPLEPYSFKHLIYPVRMDKNKVHLTEWIGICECLLKACTISPNIAKPHLFALVTKFPDEKEEFYNEATIDETVVSVLFNSQENLVYKLVADGFKWGNGDKFMPLYERLQSVAKKKLVSSEIK